MRVFSFFVESRAIFGFTLLSCPESKVLNTLEKGWLRTKPVWIRHPWLSHTFSVHPCTDLVLEQSVKNLTIPSIRSKANPNIASYRQRDIRRVTIRILIQYPTTLSYAGDLVALDSLLIHRNLQARMPAKDAVEPGWRICIGFVHLPTSPQRA